MSSEWGNGVDGSAEGFMGQDDLTSKTDNASNPDLIMANYNAMKAAEAPPPLTADNIAEMNAMKQWEANQKEYAAGENGMVEGQQNDQIEVLTEEAQEIGPDYAASMENELRQSAGAILRMKVADKVYGLLTAIEKKIGQGIVTQNIRDGFASDLWLAREYKAGRMGEVDKLGRDAQRKRAREYERDVAIGKQNIGNRTEEVRFTPSGEMLPSTGYYGIPLVAEKPTADYQIHTRQATSADRIVSPYSSRVGLSTMAAQTAVEYSPVISKLEEWRANIRARQEDARSVRKFIEENEYKGKPSNIYVGTPVGT